MLILWWKIAYAALKGDKEFALELRRSLSEMDLTVKQFSVKTSISQSELYKILSGKRGNLKMETFRKIVGFLEKTERASKVGKAGPMVGLIAFQSVLEDLPRGAADLTGDYQVREYPARTFEDCLVAAIEAEKDGASAVICAPVLASLIERVVNIPVVTMRPTQEVLVESIRKALSKVRVEKSLAS